MISNGAYTPNSCFAVMKHPVVQNGFCGHGRWGRWRQHDIKLGCAVHRKHQFLRNSRPAATRDAEEVLPGYIFFVN